MTIKKKNNVITAPEVTESQDAQMWQQFVRTVSAHIDPVLASMLYATELVSFDAGKNIVEVVTLKKFSLFQDLFVEQKHIYQEYLNRIFGYHVTLVVQFTKVEVAVAKVVPQPVVLDKPVAPQQSAVQPSKPKVAAPTQYARPFVKRSVPSGMSAVTNERTIDVSDTKKWKMTHVLLQSFGGTVREIIKDTHEFDA